MDGAWDRFGWAVSAGDTNGDGFADLVIGASRHTETPAGRAFVYHGSAMGPSTTPAATLTSSLGNPRLGESLTGAVDLNGDGFADVVIGEGFTNANEGRVYAYLGGASGVSVAPVATLSRPAGAGHLLGASVAGAHDVNGDGFADVIVVASGSTGEVSRANVYLGSAGGLAATPASSVAPPVVGRESLGVVVSDAVDINRDGFADVFLVTPVSGDATTRAYVYPGSAMGPAGMPSVTVSDPASDGSIYGTSVASAPRARSGRMRAS